MTIKQFIKENRSAIDDYINAEIYRWDGNGGRGTIPDPPPRRNDEERKLWIINDSGLFFWAKRSGVNL